MNDKTKIKLFEAELIILLQKYELSLSLSHKIEHHVMSGHCGEVTPLLQIYNKNDLHNPIQTILEDCYETIG